MDKTGAAFEFWASLAMGIIPLLPLLLILLYRKWTGEIFQWLLLGCLIALFQFLLTLAGPAGTFALNIGQLASFVVWIALFRSATLLSTHRVRFNYFLVAYLSVRVTSYALAGTGYLADEFALFQSAVIVFAATLALAREMNRHFLFIFNEPAFWIAAGLLVFHLIGGPIVAMPGWRTNAGPYIGLLLLALTIIQYACFTCAILVRTSPPATDD